MASLAGGDTLLSAAYAERRDADVMFAADGRLRPEWAALQMENRSLSNKEHVAISDLLVLAYPEEPGLYLSRFITEVSSGGTTTKTRTRLYWRRGSDGEFRIVAESNG